MGTFLGLVGGGEVHDQPLAGQGQTNGGEGGAHAFPTFGDRLVSQADDHKGRCSTSQLHLHFNGFGAGPLKGYRFGADTHNFTH